MYLCSPFLAPCVQEEAAVTTALLGLGQAADEADGEAEDSRGDATAGERGVQVSVRAAAGYSRRMPIAVGHRLASKAPCRCRTIRTWNLCRRRRSRLAGVVRRRRRASGCASDKSLLLRHDQGLQSSREVSRLAPLPLLHPPPQPRRLCWHVRVCGSRLGRQSTIFPVLGEYPHFFGRWKDTVVVVGGKRTD